MFITCSNCNGQVTKNTLPLHKKRYWCKTHHLCERPVFANLLMEQEYDTLLWEYKKVLEDILESKQINEEEI